MKPRNNTISVYGEVPDCYAIADYPMNVLFSTIDENNKVKISDTMEPGGLTTELIEELKAKDYIRVKGDTIFMNPLIGFVQGDLLKAEYRHLEILDLAREYYGVE